MGKAKGSEKTGGRQKGTTNKTTTEARELFIKTIEGQTGYIEQAFEHARQEDPIKYLDLIAKFAQYFVPKKTENSDIVKHEFPTIDMNDWK